MKRKIAAIMCADVVGYSRLVSEDEEEALRRLLSYRTVFETFVQDAGGRIFNTAGDAVLAEFSSAVDAVRAAIDIQESIRTRNVAYPKSRQMLFRMGITIGDVVEQDGDLLGDAVNIAARLETLAEPGGICLSQSVREQVANKLSAQFLDLGAQNVKNIPQEIRAYAVALMRPPEPVAAPAKTSGGARTIAAAAIGALVLLAAGAGGYAFLSGGSEPPAPRQLAAVAPDAPAEPPAEAPAQTPPAEAPAQTPAEAPAQMPAEAAAEAPVVEPAPVPTSPAPPVVQPQAETATTPAVARTAALEASSPQPAAEDDPVAEKPAPQPAPAADVASPSDRRPETRSPKSPAVPGSDEDKKPRKLARLNSTRDEPPARPQPTFSDRPMRGQSYQSERVPFICDPCRAKLGRSYGAGARHKAIAINTFGDVGWVWGEPTTRRARRAALDRCRKEHGRDCEVFVVNGRVVWDSPEPVLPNEPWILRDAPQRPFDVSGLVTVNETTRALLGEKYSDAPAPKAIAVSADGAWSYFTGGASDREVMRQALQVCSHHAKAVCTVAALNDRLVNGGGAAVAAARAD